MGHLPTRAVFQQTKCISCLGFPDIFWFQSMEVFRLSSILSYVFHIISCGWNNKSPSHKWICWCYKPVMGDPLTLRQNHIPEVPWGTPSHHPLFIHFNGLSHEKNHPFLGCPPCSSHVWPSISCIVTSMKPKKGEKRQALMGRWDAGNGVEVFPSYTILVLMPGILYYIYILYLSIYLSIYL